MLKDLRKREVWFYPRFLLWVTAGLRNGEIRGLTWDCIRWEDGEVLLCKSLRRDGYSSGQHSWVPTKTGKAMEAKVVFDANGLLFVTSESYGNFYNQLMLNQ